MKVKGDNLPASHGHCEVHQMDPFSSSKEVNLAQEYFSLTNSA